MTKPVDWSAYAVAYDDMANNNPAYQEIVAICLETASSWTLPKGTRLVDLGAGTGNFSLLLAQKLPQCEIVHVDANEAMTRIAAEKAARAGITNLQILCRSAEDVEFSRGSVHAIVTVHALNAFKDPRDVIQKMAGWLAPGGHILACDIGRRLNVLDWTGYLLWGTARRKGLLKTLSLATSAQRVFLQNWRGAHSQEQGRFWSHEPEEFSDCYKRAGITVDKALVCYRGCSDLVIGQKPNL